MSSAEGMDRARWTRVESLLDRCLALRVEERAGYLDEACGLDSELRGQVEALLQADERAVGFLEAPALEQAAPLIAAVPEDSMAGAQIGAYRVLREAGRGGMGLVYLAERADGGFQQRVALKLIKRGMDSEAIQQRFLHERQILARLEHPNIARLLDGGVTPQGQPYFAMEFVDGTPLTEHCDERRLGVDARLRLFQTACIAVQYAHQNLVVHRDLKPSNMLVTGDGELKLVDFGIAKLLRGEDGGATLTDLGFRALTPEYAAPEQLQGEPVTTATDVYALGVVLYELLAGRRPRDAGRGDPAALVRLASEEPVRPSTAAGRPPRGEEPAGAGPDVTRESVSRRRGTRPERLRRRLAGDLDTICLKALRRDPQRRYASAQALHDDIQRHLTGLPVLARPDTLPYRVSRFVRRHRVGVAATGAIALLLLGFTAVTAVQSARIRDQAHRLARERDKAEEVKDFVLSLFEASNPVVEGKAEPVTAHDLLERGVERIDGELIGQPEVQAEMVAVIGQAYEEMGVLDRAGTLLERALELRRSTLGPQHRDTARSMAAMGALLRARGDYAAAEPMLRHALAIQRRLLGDEDLDVASTLNSLGVLLRQKGDPAAAEPLYREALAIRRALLGEEHPEVLTTMNNLAVLLHQQGNLDAAEALHRETLAVRRRVLGPDHPHVALSLSNLAWVLYDKGDYAAAEPIYREAIAVQRRVLGEAHPGLALNLNSLAAVLVQEGKIDAAEPLAREGLAMRRRLLGEENADVASSLRTLAEVAYQRHDLATAERLTREALAMFRRTLPEGHPRTAVALIALGRIAADRGRPEEAGPYFREALAIRRAAYGEDHPLTREAGRLLGTGNAAGEEEEDPEAMLEALLARSGAAEVAVALERSLRQDTAAPADARILHLLLARGDGLPREEFLRLRDLLADHPYTGEARLTSSREPGEPVRLSGRILGPGGEPVAGARLLIFQTDARGFYTRRDEAAGRMDEPAARLFAHLLADGQGRYAVRTVRPGGYPLPRGDVPASSPLRLIPAHIHFQVTAPGHAERRFQVVFDDDPRMNPEWRRWAEREGSPVLRLEPAGGEMAGTLDVELRRDR